MCIRYITHKTPFFRSADIEIMRVIYMPAKTRIILKRLKLIIQPSTIVELLKRL